MGNPYPTISKPVPIGKKHTNQPRTKARHSVIETIEVPIVRCVDGVVAIHDQVLGMVLILITKEGVGVCTRNGCQAVGEDFLEKYREVLSSNKV